MKPKATLTVAGIPVTWDGARAESSHALTQQTLSGAATVFLTPPRQRHESLGQHGQRVLKNYLGLAAEITEDADLPDGCLPV